MILSIFSYIYTFGHLINYYILHRPKRVKAKVVCVGNVNIGGGGKTPLCLALAKILQQHNKKVAFISRGYKGSLSSWGAAVKVNSSFSYLEVGDEPLLLAEVAPTYISKNRYLAAKMAEEEGAEVIIMDDGMQNNTLHKDITLLVIDGGVASLGNQKVIPAGPLREPLSLALRKADYCFSLNNQNPPLRLGCKTIEAHTEVLPLAGIEKQKYVALCGIARPEKFLQSLERLGAKIIEKIIFPDHHKFNYLDLKRIEQACAEHACGMITTAKDFVRLPDALKTKAVVLPIEIKIPNAGSNVYMASLIEEIVLVK